MGREIMVSPRFIRTLELSYRKLLFTSRLNELPTNGCVDLGSSLKVNSSLRKGLRVSPIFHLCWAFISLLYSYFLTKNAHPIHSWIYHVFTWFCGRPLSSIEARIFSVKTILATSDLCLIQIMCLHCPCSVIHLHKFFREVTRSLPLYSESSLFSLTVKFFKPSLLTMRSQKFNSFYLLLKVKVFFLFSFFLRN